MPGFRSLIFAFAGLSKMSYFRFCSSTVWRRRCRYRFLFPGVEFAETSRLAGLDTIGSKHILLPPVIILLAVFVLCT